jgi:hypothetical protein
MYRSQLKHKIMAFLFIATCIAVPSIIIVLFPVSEGRDYRILAFLMLLLSTCISVALLKTTLEVFVSKEDWLNWTKRKWEETLFITRILSYATTALNILSLVKGRPLLEIKPSIEQSDCLDADL